MLSHFTVQNGWTVLKQASFSGHYKVVELLLGAGANPDLQDKVRTGQESDVHTLKMLRRSIALHASCETRSPIDNLLLCLYVFLVSNYPKEFRLKLLL